MRASDAQPGDMLHGIPEIYLREVGLTNRAATKEWAGFKPNPPKRILVAHKWMAWYEAGGFKKGGDDLFVYIGHRWLYKDHDVVKGKKRRRIVREVLFRGRPCWVDPNAWRYIEKVNQEEC